MPDSDMVNVGLDEICSRCYLTVLTNPDKNSEAREAVKRIAVSMIEKAGFVRSGEGVYQIPESRKDDAMRKLETMCFQEYNGPGSLRSELEGLEVYEGVTINPPAPKKDSKAAKIAALILGLAIVAGSIYKGCENAGCTPCPEIYSGK